MLWWQVVAATIASGLFGGALSAFIKTRPVMKQAVVQGEAALWAEIHGLKNEADRERERCDERIARLEDRHSNAFAELRAEFAADVSVARHDRNNTKQVLIYLLVRIKKIDHPELRDLAEEAESLLARGDEVLALEKGAMRKRK